MKKNRILQILAVMLICIFGITACKKDVGAPEDNAAANVEETEETDNEYVIGFSAIDMENPYFITLEESAREIFSD